MQLHSYACATPSTKLSCVVCTYVRATHTITKLSCVVCTKHQCCTYLRTCHTHYHKAFLLYAPSTKLSCVVRTYVRATPTITKLSCVVCTKHQCCTYLRTCHTHYHKAFLLYTPSTKLSCVVRTYVRATSTITKLSCCMHQAPSYPVLYVPTYVPHPLSQSFPVVYTKHQAILCCTYLRTCHIHYHKAFLLYAPSTKLSCVVRTYVRATPTITKLSYACTTPTITKLSCIVHTFIHTCTCHTHCHKAFLCCLYVHATPTITYLCTDASYRCSHCMNLTTRMLSNPTLSASWA